MRYNLTNVAETQLDKVDSFYVVGSTTKEGLLEGRSNVKIDLKKAVAGGGGTSGEEAERMYEALFGQMPYVFVPEVSPAPVALPEAVTSVNSDVSNSFEREALYKKKEPSPAKGLNINYSAVNNSWSISFYENAGIFVELPEEALSGGPWYSFVPAEVDLSEFPVPVVAGDPVPLTGMELPIQPTLKTFHIEAGLQEYTLTTEDTTLYKCVVQQGELQIMYTIEEVEGVWMWKEEEMDS